MSKIKEIKKVPYGNRYLEVVVYENDEFPEPVVCHPLPMNKTKRFFQNLKNDIHSIFIDLCFLIAGRYFKD